MSNWIVTDLPKWVQPNITIDPDTGCFRVGAGNGIWVDRDGYAHKGLKGVHRLVYTECVGVIPEGLVLDHVRLWGCRFRDCSLPSHLQPCTVRENTLRGDSFAAANAARTTCSTCSAPYGGPNLYTYPDGRRDCRTCRALARERYAERKTIAAAHAAGYLFPLSLAA